MARHHAAGAVRVRGQGRIPVLLALPAVLALAFLLLPLLGLLVRAPWSQAGQVLTSTGALQALRLSLVTATVATVIAVLLGVPAGLAARPARVCRRPPCSGAGHRAAGAAPGGRRGRPVHGARPVPGCWVARCTS
jgi:ABC-type uncharacterized transport system YnjBCD permease subunit